MNKELTWAEHIHRCLELGVSKKAYCEEHNLSYQLFFHHQRKLTESKSSVGFKEILLRNEHMQNRESDDASESVLQVQFANGCTLFFSEHLLESVFQLCQSQWSHSRRTNAIFCTKASPICERASTDCVDWCATNSIKILHRAASSSSSINRGRTWRYCSGSAMASHCSTNA